MLIPQMLDMQMSEQQGPQPPGWEEGEEETAMMMLMVTMIKG